MISNYCMSLHITIGKINHKGVTISTIPLTFFVGVCKAAITEPILNPRRFFSSASCVILVELDAIASVLIAFFSIYFLRTSSAFQTWYSSRKYVFVRIVYGAVRIFCRSTIPSIVVAFFTVVFTNLCSTNQNISVRDAISYPRRIGRVSVGVFQIKHIAIFTIKSTFHGLIGTTITSTIPLL